MSNINYRQCKLVNAQENKQTMSWIPAEFAKVGERLLLKDNDAWEGGWVVETASSNLVPANLIEGQAHNCGNIWLPSSNLTNRGNK